MVCCGSALPLCMRENKPNGAITGQMLQGCDFVHTKKHTAPWSCVAAQTQECRAETFLCIHRPEDGSTTHLWNVGPTVPHEVDTATSRPEIIQPSLAPCHPHTHSSVTTGQEYSQADWDVVTSAWQVRERGLQIQNSTSRLSQAHPCRSCDAHKHGKIERINLMFNK
jgi:hypothetical protein